MDVTRVGWINGLQLGNRYIEQSMHAIVACFAVHFTITRKINRVCTINSYPSLHLKRRSTRAFYRIQLAFRANDL